MATDPSRFRDSTQIVLPCEELADVRDPLTDEYTVTVVSVGDGQCKIVGSPVEIKGVSGFLARHGVSLR